MTETASSIQRLLEANPLREPVLRSIIQSLELTPGSHGLDAGCGIGLQALLLAEAVGPQGDVTGCDIAPELLAYGERMVEEAGLCEQISFREADVSCLPWSLSLKQFPAPSANGT